MQLIEIAQAAGYTDPAVAQCITDRTYDTYIRDKTKEVLGGGVNSTPSVFINGKAVERGQLSSPEEFRRAIAAAR